MIIDFTQYHFHEKPAGMTDALAEIYLPQLFSLLSEQERKQIIEGQQNPWPEGDPHHQDWKAFDPVHWLFPEYSLPESFLECLRYSNGGTAFNGEREIQFFPIEEIREMMLGYHVPQYMPLVAPFAFDGGGIFYAFDMRNNPVNGEFPVLAAEANVLDFDSSPIIASTFKQVLDDQKQISDWIYGDNG